MAWLRGSVSSSVAATIGHPGEHGEIVARAATLFNGWTSEARQRMTGRERILGESDLDPTVSEFFLDGVRWEEYIYGHGETWFQRKCPDCDRGLLLAPAQFCPRCDGRGLIATTTDPREAA